MSTKRLKVAAKVCGGCNPLIDREKLKKDIEELMERTRHAIIEVPGEKKVDVLFLVGGCRNCCVNRPENRSMGQECLVIEGEVPDPVIFETQIQGWLLRLSTESNTTKEEKEQNH